MSLWAWGSLGWGLGDWRIRELEIGDWRLETFHEIVEGLTVVE